MKNLKKRHATRRKLTIGIGIIVHFLMQFVHTSKNIRDKYPNQERGCCLEGYVVTGKCIKQVSEREQTVITFCCDEFNDIKLYAIDWYCRITE